MPGQRAWIPSTSASVIAYYSCRSTVTAGHKSCTVAGQELRIPPIAWRANPLDWLPEWGGKCHFCPKKLLCRGDLEPGLWLFEDWTLVESQRVLGGWVAGLERGLDSCLMVNKERPEQAFGSWAFTYFCQVQMSRLVEAGSWGNFLMFPLVEFVFLLSVWLCYLPHGNT